MLENKKNRSGYDEAQTEKGMLYKETVFSEFLKSDDPYGFISGFHKFSIDKETEKIFPTLSPTITIDDLRDLCSDLKVQGKRELQSLLKLRMKYKR